MYSVQQNGKNTGIALYEKINVLMTSWVSSINKKLLFKVGFCDCLNCC